MAKASTASAWTASSNTNSNRHRLRPCDEFSLKALSQDLNMLLLRWHHAATEVFFH
jgi:hypothetical protein